MPTRKQHNLFVSPNFCARICRQQLILGGAVKSAVCVRVFMLNKMLECQVMII